jgi:hypothetical protein
MIILSVVLGVTALVGSIMYYKSKKKQKPKVPDTKVIQILRALILKSVGNKQIIQMKKM